jgi:hypothetical protein
VKLPVSCWPSQVMKPLPVAVARGAVSAGASPSSDVGTSL